jgi:lysophospholipase L1-like esterase
MIPRDRKFATTDEQGNFSDFFLAPLRRLFATKDEIPEIPDLPDVPSMQEIANSSELQSAVASAVEAGLAGLGGGTAVARTGPDIACDGDSITAGAGGGGTSYPGVLQSFLTAGGYLGTVRNLGVGGESSRGISARQGGRPVLVTVPTGSIPASGGVVVTIAYDDGVGATLLTGGTAGVNPVEISGVRGTLSLSTGTYTFTRAVAGNVVDVPFPAPLITAASRDRRDDIHIMGMGQNDGAFDVNVLIGRYRAMIEHIRPGIKNWLVLGLHTGNAASRAATETAMITAFGRRYVNTRQWLSSSAALLSVGITPTTADQTAIAEGSLPRSFWANTTAGSEDAVHLNAAGYTAYARFIFARLVELDMLLKTSDIPTPLPDPLPQPYALGVDDWDHRYIASSLSVGTLAKWRDHGASPLDLTPVSGDTGAAEIVLDGTNKIARFTTNENVSYRLSDNKPLAPDTRTVAVVMRYNTGTTAGTPQFVKAHGVVARRQSNGTFAASGAGTPLISVASPTMSLGAWRVVFFQVAQPTLSVDGTEVTTASGWVPTETSDFWVGVTGGAAGAGTRIIDFAEVIQFPRHLSQSERATVRAAIQAHYDFV